MESSSDSRGRPIATTAETGGDEDDISLTSTAESEFQDEYEVDTIHAQEHIEGRKMYLVKWKGYSDLRCTWEPATSFNTGETLDDWKKKRNEINAGLRARFDIEKWQAECKAFEDASHDRKRRRRAKRARLGLPLSGQKKAEPARAIHSDDSSSSDEDRPLITSKERSHIQPTTKQYQNINTTSTQSKTSNMFNTSNQPKANSQPKASSQPRSSSQPKTSSLPKISTQIRTSAQPKTLAPQATATKNQVQTARRTSVHKAPPPEPVAFKVLDGRTERRDFAHALHRHREQAPADKNKTWQLFQTIRRAEKASRQDPEPNRDELELQSPQTWHSYQMSSSRRRPKPIESEPLFVQQDEDVPEIQEKASPSPLTATSSPILHSRKPSASDDVALAITSIRNAQEIRKSSVSDSSSFYTSDVYPPTEPRSWKPSKKRGFHVGSRELGKRTDLLCTLLYSPDTIEVGDTLLCDLSEYARPLVYKLRYKGEIRVRFNELCTLKHYQSVSDEIRRESLFNGCITAYPDTQDKLSAFEKLLLDKDLVGIARICPDTKEPDQGLTLFCYPVNSKSFQFLNKHPYDVPRGSLCITGRSGILPRRAQNVTPDISDTRKKSQTYERPEREGRFVEPDKSETAGLGLIPWRLPSKALRPNDSSLEVIKKPLELHTGHSDSTNQATDVSQNTQLDVSMTPAINKQKEAHDAPDAPDAPDADSDAMDISDSDMMNTTDSPILPIKNNLDNSTPKIVADDPILAPHVVETSNEPLSNQVADDNQDVPMLDVNAIEDVKEFLDGVFLNNFHINFDQLAAITSRASAKLTNCFYLWFPESAGEEYQILERFLDSHDAIILSNRKHNDWDKFTKSPTGVALFHHTFLDYNELPGFRKLTMSPSFNFWNVSLKTPIPDLDPATNFQRLFPHGSGYLMTEDFMVNEKDAAIIILAWFRETALSKIPGTTKMMFRPDIMNWLDRMSKQDPRFTVMATLIGDIACQGDPSNWPVESKDLDCFRNTLLQSPVISLAVVPQINSNGPADAANSGENEASKTSRREQEADLLCEVFAAWAVLNATSLRRFNVITHTKPKERWQKWQHIEITQGANEFFQRWGINKENYTKWLAQKPTSRKPSLAPSPSGALPSTGPPTTAMKSNTVPHKMLSPQIAQTAVSPSLPPRPPRPS